MSTSDELAYIRQQRADFMLLISLLKALSEHHPVRIHFEERLFASDFDEDADFAELFLALARMIATHEPVMRVRR